MSSQEETRVTVRDNELLEFGGRIDEREAGYPLHWTGSYVLGQVRASRLEVEIDCRYTVMKPYISFEVDGLKAQTFAPLVGKYWYNVFLGLDPEKVHTFRILKETQPFRDDPMSFVHLMQLKTDGELLPVEKKNRRLVFIGDSLTSGEGGRGPKEFMEWVPMVFCASETYTRFTADRLNATYQVISQSGWGMACAWNNEPGCTLPDIFDLSQMYCSDGAAPDVYPFDYQPTDVVIALGANDRNAIHEPPWVDPKTGISYKLEGSEACMKEYQEKCERFIRHIHERNPGAKIHWLLIDRDGEITAAIQKAIAEESSRGTPVSVIWSTLGYRELPAEYAGSRDHPGTLWHRRMAEDLYRAMK